MGLLNGLRKLRSYPVRNTGFNTVQTFINSDSFICGSYWNPCFIQYEGIILCFCFAFQITYIETSAKDPPMNVDKAFHELVRVIR